MTDDTAEIRKDEAYPTNVPEYYPAILSALAENPGLTNLGVSRIIKRPLGSMGPSCRAARKALGISDTQGASAAYIKNYGLYVQGCTAIGVKPQKGTAFVKVHTRDAVPRMDSVDPTKDVDPMQEVRDLTHALRDRMAALDLERIEITATDTNVTRIVRTTSTFTL